MPGTIMKSMVLSWVLLSFLWKGSEQAENSAWWREKQLCPPLLLWESLSLEMDFYLVHSFIHSFVCFSTAQKNCPVIPHWSFPRITPYLVPDPSRKNEHRPQAWDFCHKSTISQSRLPVTFSHAFCIFILCNFLAQKKWKRKLFSSLDFIVPVKLHLDSFLN